MSRYTGFSKRLLDIPMDPELMARVSLNTALGPSTITALESVWILISEPMPKVHSAKFTLPEKGFVFSLSTC